MVTVGRQMARGDGKRCLNTPVWGLCVGASIGKGAHVLHKGTTLWTTAITS